ncbi:MAG: hypothetical protein NUV34_01835, partial [Sulfuricaulis sp.]|nr:hypothetical protein [Sulfuricaulis sp.]
DQFATNFAQTQANLEYQGASDKTRFGMEAEQFAGQQATADRQAQLAEQQNRQDILRRPSDFVNYAFQSRGKVAPTERISHADLINAASAAAAERQAASNEAVARLRGLAANAPTPRLVAPTVSARLVAPPPTAATAPLLDPGLIGGGAAYIGGGNPEAERVARAAFAPGGAYGAVAGSRFASGTGDGMTREPMFRVGEEPSGKPNDTEETIVNPEHAPIGVIKNPATGAQEDPALKKRAASADAINRMMQHVEDPKLQHALVDEVAKMRAGSGMPRFALGTGQTLEQMARAGQPVTQGDIFSAAQQFAPPAVTDLTSGNRISRFTPAFPSMTPRKAAMLTPSEREAANSYFGVVGNTTLADELGGIQSTFGPSVGRARSRFVSY